MDAGVLQLFADRRMVLCLPCGDGAELAKIRERAVAVGLDADAAAVQRCRDQKLVAWPGTWRALAAQRQKFDAVYVDGARLGPSLTTAEHAGFFATLAASLLPNGLLVLAGLPPFAATGLELRPSPPGVQVFGKARAAPIARSAPQPIVLGGYADAFVGCERVLELGSGAGHFLDALHVRDIACVGVEPDAEAAAALCARGHKLLSGLSELITHPHAFAGVHVGQVAETLSPRALEVLLVACRHVLRPHGRLLLRASRTTEVAPLARELSRRLGYVAAHVGAVPGDATDHVLLAVADTEVRRATPTLAADLATLQLPTRELPVNQPIRSRFDLDRFERRICSQGGEDGVLAALFAMLGTTNRHYVEFGCGDGVQCNTAALRRQGWRGLIMDGVAKPGAPDAAIVAAWITRDNINALFDQHGVPSEPDLMSIDIDGNDYWVWQAITRRPRVIVAEYNANLGPDEALTIPYDEAHQWNGTDYYGASLAALDKLGRAKGYTLVYCNHAGVNAFFVRDDLMGDERRREVRELYKPPNYWYRGARQVPDLTRAMVAV